MKSKVYVCPFDQCDRAYSAHINLKRHVDCMHLMRKNFTCPFCAKQLSSKQNFREHLYIHTGEKPFNCPHCPSTFRQGSQLSQHKKIHKRSKPRPSQPFFKLTDLASFSPDLFFNPSAPRPVYSLKTAGLSWQELPSLREENKDKIVVETRKAVIF